METIVLTKIEFDQLPTYSCSIPTGTTIGKRWKRGAPYINPDTWYLCEYVEASDTKMIGIHYKLIVGILKLKV